jgi:hypothetical protein
MVKDCVFCENCTYDPEYMAFPQSKREPIIGGALLCEQPVLKDYAYNTLGGKRKSRKELVDSDMQPPVLVGKVVWICKGQYFKQSDKSVLDEEDPDDVEDNLLEGFVE